MKAYIPGRGLSVWRWYATPCRIHQPYRRPMSRFRPLGPPSLPPPLPPSLPPLYNPSGPYRRIPWSGSTIEYQTVQRTEYTQSFRLSLQSSELGQPPPLTRKRVLPPFWFQGGGHTRLRERGRGDPIRTTHTLNPLRCNVSGSPLFLDRDALIFPA
jgi:hypothetical protein